MDKQTNINKQIIGISTAGGYTFLPFKRRLELIKAAGFESVMLWWGNGEIEPPLERAALAKECGLIIENAHAEMSGSNSLWESGADGDKKAESLIKSIDECRISGIARMVVHVTNGASPPEISDIGLKRIEKIITHAIKNEVTLAIENVRSAKHTMFVLDCFKDTHVGLCYDCGHAGIWCKSVDWLLLYGDRIKAVHLHDNDGLSDDHNIPFSGKIDWLKVMKALEKTSYSGTLTLEAEYQGAENSDMLFDYLKRAYKSGVSLQNLKI